MKVLTLTQPWATFVAAGGKSIETRDWRTAYRGPIAIHAAKSVPAWVVDWARDPEIASLLERERVQSPLALPRGCVVAIARRAAVEPTEIARAGRLVTEREELLGDFGPGRFAWHLRDLSRLPQPVAARGALGLWDWRDEATERWLIEQGWPGGKAGK